MSELSVLVKEKYTNFLLKISSNEDDETKKYDIENFIETQSDSTNFIELFINNFFLHTQEILEQNVDFFATQKKYVLITKKGKQMKKRNPRRSYIFGREDEQLFYQYLVKNKKINYKVAGQYLEMLSEILNSLVTKDDNNKYVFHQEFLDIIQNHENVDKYQVIIDNIDSILTAFEENEEEEEEDESVEELEAEEDESEHGDEQQTQNEMPNIPGFNNDFIKNSQIGKLAEEISKSINPEEMDLENANPADLMKNLFSGGGENGNGGIGKIVQHVFGEVESRIQNGNIDENALANEAKNFLGAMGGAGGGMGGLGNIAEIFGNMGDFDDGDSVPKKSKKSKKSKKKGKSKK